MWNVVASDLRIRILPVTTRNTTKERVRRMHQIRRGLLFQDPLFETSAEAHEDGVQRQGQQSEGLAHKLGLKV